MLNRFTLAGLSALTLTACGGTSSDGPTTTGPTAAELAETRLDTYERTGTTLANTLASIPYTDPRTLPTTGAATYDGVLGAELATGDVAFGAMELNANFAQSTINGRVFDLVGADVTPITGSLTIRSAPIDRTANTAIDFTYTADLTGRLVDSANRELVVDGELLGDFTGAAARYIEGFVSGTVAIDGVNSAITDGEFYGELR